MACNKMKRFLLIAIPCFLAGAVFGAVFWYLASPLWIDRTVSENLVTVSSSQILATGTFKDADFAHKGSGKATLVQLDSGAELQLSDFKVTNGPDLKVWLSNHENPTSASHVLDGEWLSLGPLKGNIGDQRYSIPADADLTKFKSVVIWCEQFGVLFSPAALSSN